MDVYASCSCYKTKVVCVNIIDSSNIEDAGSKVRQDRQTEFSVHDGQHQCIHEPRDTYVKLAKTIESLTLHDHCFVTVSGVTT